MPDNAKQVVEDCKHLGNDDYVEEGVVVLQHNLHPCNVYVKHLQPPFLSFYASKDVEADQNKTPISNTVSDSKE